MATKDRATYGAIKRRMYAPVIAPLEFGALS
jgi:hypothetical protein